MNNIKSAPMILGFLKTFISSVALLSSMCFSNNVHAQQATNPIIFADVPDMSMMRVGDTYYMSVPPCI